MRNKKAQVMQNLGALGIGIATLAIVLTVAFLVVSQTQDNITTQTGNDCNSTNSADLACNATLDLQAAAATVPGWVGLIVLVAIGAIILGMISMFGKR